MFKKLDERKTNEVEKSILDTWQKENILSLSTKGDENFVFYDGPIYANAKPGIHHVFAKTIKDAFCKYNVMNGKKVIRKIGLDTHGLPIEVNVEKKLGFSGKADIEKFGVENFCKECNKETASNIDEVDKVTQMMGQFIDTKNPYITCSNDYIESEWWILKTMHEKGLIYYGSKVLPYCPRCGTELASHEVSQGYEEDSVNTVIVPFKIKNKDEYMLVWTTTPWTLIDNVAACVNPDLTYVKVESMGYKFILCEHLTEKVLGTDVKVIETFKGTDLVGTEYEQLMPFAKVEGKAFVVVADSYVTSDDGTGIVHIAPAYGADDNRVCVQNEISFVQSVGSDGKYKIGPWKGTLVTDKDLEINIIKYLKENDKLFKKIKMVHDYPHCWRCKSPLIYYAKPAWYVKTTAYKDKIIEANKTINWYPDYVGQKRFNNWLENMIDWGISRNRYWGCPLPIWVCDDCKHFDVIGSVKELSDRANEKDIDIKKMELHRPYVDNITMTCPKCNGKMHRVSDVLDVWFDSGSMPYAQYHYPFENKELFEQQFPADFIAEGVDQTRGWFYVLLVISTIISDKSSFKNVVVNDMMLDKNGKKMSKSVGNIIDPISIMEKYGADTIRWYMLYASAVWTPLKFDEDGVKEVYSKFINPLKNTYSFFQMYANVDNIDIDKCNIDYSQRKEIDKWLLSKYNNLVKNVRNAFNEYDLNKVTKYITSFVSDDLSNWYIRRNRNRFWGNKLDNSKKSVYITTYEVLSGLCKLIAPISPYVSEEIYTNLTSEKSVHLSSYPICNEKLINPSLEEKMDLVRDLISIGRYAREENKIKVRQPLSQVLLDGKYESIIADLTSLIKEELNVKEVRFINDINTYMNFEVKPNFKEAGKIFGKNMKAYQEKLSNIKNDDLENLQNGKSITLNINNENYEITPSLVDIRYNAKEGFDIGMDNGKFVILNAVITDSLKKEGNAREFVSKVQALRKEYNFDIDNRIIISVNAEDEFKTSIEDNLDYVKNETLAIEINFDDSMEKEFTLNEKNIGIKLERVA